MFRKSLFIILMVLTMGCSIVKDSTYEQKGNSLITGLGAIGLEKTTLLGTSFNQIGNPELSNKVSVQFSLIPFNKNTYNTYKAYVKNNAIDNVLLKNDSTTERIPRYISLKIADRIGMVNALNDNSNKALQLYLDNDSNYKMISSIMAAVDIKIIQRLKEADEIYLISQNTSTLKLELIKEGKTVDHINFSVFQIFNYKTASFCWGKDNLNKKCIRAIVDGKNTCPKDTHKKAFKVDTKNDFKF